MLSAVTAPPALVLVRPAALLATAVAAAASPEPVPLVAAKAEGLCLDIKKVAVFAVRAATGTGEDAHTGVCEVELDFNVCAVCLV